MTRLASERPKWRRWLLASPFLLLLAYALLLPCRNILLEVENATDAAVAVIFLADESLTGKRILWQEALMPGHHDVALMRKLGEGSFAWEVKLPAQAESFRQGSEYFSGSSFQHHIGLRIAESGLERTEPPRWTLNNMLFGDAFGTLGGILSQTRCMLWLDL